MLGDLKETNFNDPTKPDLIFELEANNFFSKDGNIKKGKYFEDGYVEEEGEAGPGVALFVLLFVLLAFCASCFLCFLLFWFLLSWLAFLARWFGSLCFDLLRMSSLRIE